MSHGFVGSTFLLLQGVPGAGGTGPRELLAAHGQVGLNTEFLLAVQVIPVEAGVTVDAAILVSHVHPAAGTTIPVGAGGLVVVHLFLELGSFLVLGEGLHGHEPE